MNKRRDKGKENFRAFFVHELVTFHSMGWISVENLEMCHAIQKKSIIHDNRKIHTLKICVIDVSCQSWDFVYTGGSQNVFVTISIIVQSEDMGFRDGAKFMGYPGRVLVGCMLDGQIWVKVKISQIPYYRMSIDII